MVNKDILKRRFTLYKYDSKGEQLKKLLRNNGYPIEQIDPIDKTSILTGLHYYYLHSYLYLEGEGLKAKTIVVEEHYTSLPYWRDYVNYYGKMYFNYPRECKRIHFFGSSFTADKFEELILNPREFNNTIWNNYIGCIVLRPVIGNGVIGPSLLKTYKHHSKDGRTRFYTAVRNYNINLFGKELTVNTMPWCAHDGIASCCISALWFAFQQTSELFQNPIPHPSDITLAAGIDLLSSNGDFTSNGLQVEQVLQAIHENGLQSHFGNIDPKIQDDKWLKSFSYAYLKMGIPVMLGLNIEGQGLHLVTMNGFSLLKTDTKNPEYANTWLNFNMTSDRIDKFYVADDAIGCFARLGFDTKRATGHQLVTSWFKDPTFDKMKNRTQDYYGADSYCVIVPIDESIKVAYTDVARQAKFLENLFRQILPGDYQSLVFEIYLSKSNEYKKQLKLDLKRINKLNLNPDANCLMFDSLPKFIWLIRISLHDINLVDYIIDAGDTHSVQRPYRLILLNKSLKETFAGFDKTGAVPQASLFHKAAEYTSAQWRNNSSIEPVVFNRPFIPAYYNDEIQKLYEEQTNIKKEEDVMVKVVNDITIRKEIEKSISETLEERIKNSKS